jgi:hypothetical protein
MWSGDFRTGGVVEIAKGIGAAISSGHGRIGDRFSMGRDARPFGFLG